MRTHGTQIAMTSVLLVSFRGGAHATIGSFMNTRSSVFDVSNENTMEEIEEQFARLCINDPYLKYLHFDANLGSTSFEDCTWVGESPDDRCILHASNGGQSTIGSTTPTLLRDICPLSCGLCPPELLDYASRATEREDNFLTDDEITLEEIKELEIKLRRKKRNFKTKRKGRKPCPCPDGHNHGGGDGEEQGDGPIIPSPTEAPTDPGTEMPTYFPTYSDTSSATSEETTEATLAVSFSATSSITSTYTSVYTSTFTTSNTLSSTEIGNGSVITSVVSGQKSISNGSQNRRVIVSLSVLSALLLLLTFYCLACWRKKRNAEEGNKDVSDEEDSDTDESAPEYPIHKTKSADSVDSFLQRVLVHFNGQRDDARTDVHTCTSAVCDVCNNTPRRVMSVDSYSNQRRKKKETQDRYRTKEMEC